jgi:hypothetical protein
MSFPDYFADRAQKCLELAKRMHNLALTFSEPARLLAQTATEAKRWLGRINGANKPSPHVVVSQAKALYDLERELQELPDTTSLCVPLLKYSRDQRDEFWRACPHLSRQFERIAEFRPDQCLWFVKLP